VRILAVDPGETTGYAYAHFGVSPKTMPKLFADMARGFNQACAWLEVDLPRYGGIKTPTLVVLERFTINAETAKKSTQGSKTAIELCGVVRYLAHVGGYKLEEQAPVDAKSFVTDEKLKRLGWYTPGPDHARDATRHLVLAAIRHQALDSRLLLPDTLDK